MDTLEGTDWDVLISGTGIQQSLLALALSRSGKKVLHIDKNDVYGGSEAALSLQEAELFADIVNSESCRSSFSDASVTRFDHDDTTPGLGSSRSYNLSLAPTLLYTRSALLPVLVSSRAHQQLEFQAVGSWFVYGQTTNDEADEGGSSTVDQSKLIRVPNGREDIFADQSLSLKAKGSLVKFLRFVSTYEEKPEVWQAHEDTPFPDFLSQQFNLPPSFHAPLLALTFGSNIPQSIPTGFALQRIARHLRSIGMFGPGFGAVIPKWGGLSEVAQVACRAGAVGGAVYVLGKGIDTVEDNDVEEVPRPELSQQDISQEVSDAIGANQFLPTDEESLDSFETEIKDQSLEELLAAAGYSVDADENSKPAEPTPAVEEPPAAAPEQPKKFAVRLEGGESVKADYIVGTLDDLPEGHSGRLIAPQVAATSTPALASRCISIVSAPLSALFPPTSEGGITPAGAVVVFPSGSLVCSSTQTPPVYVIAHTSDTAECPKGQTVLYASIALKGEEAFPILNQAVQQLIASQSSDIRVLWTLQYQQGTETAISTNEEQDGNILRFPRSPLDLSFDDTMLENVKTAWQQITGSNDDEFMKFEDREASAEEDQDNEI